MVGLIYRQVIEWWGSMRVKDPGFKLTAGRFLGDDELINDVANVRDISSCPDTRRSLSLVLDCAGERNRALTHHGSKPRLGTGSGSRDAVVDGVQQRPV